MLAPMAGGRLERALRIRGALGGFFETTSVPIAVLETDARIASANEACILHYGYGLDELVEMHVKQLHAVPREAAAMSSDTARLILAGELRELGRRPHRRKDGSVLWALPKTSPATVEGEQFIVSVLQDVTALVTAEEKGRQEEQRAGVLWNAVIERAGRSFALLDRDCRILRANGTLLKRTRRTAEELQGMACRDAFPGGCTRQPCIHATALAERRRVVEEAETSYGLPLRIEAWPAEPNDVGIALVHASEDLSEERAMRSRLLTTDHLTSLGRVTAAVAHEVNNPAGFVLLALPLIRQSIAQGRIAEAFSLVDDARDAMMQITTIMRDLRGFGRDDPPSVVDLGAVANGALRIAAYEAERRARIDRIFEEGVSAEVRGGRVAQVILNLVVNAAQAIPEGDPASHRIEIRVQRAEGRAVVEVADSGSGVPAEIGDRIFEPFFTTRSDIGGTGMGLWLSRAIVEEEGGTLTWRNRPSTGAVFTVSLPLQRGA
jgi:PAS domain S-box-containing protein